MIFNPKILAYFIIVAGIFIVASMTEIPQVFALVGSEYEPTQPNALASYNSETKQVNVTWDFNTLPIDTTCLLKGDFYYYSDLNNEYAHGVGIRDIDYNYIKSFIPRFYSAVSDNPITFHHVGNYTENVSCVGSMKIDLDTVMNHPQNINNFQDSQIFLTFYVLDENGKFSIYNKHRIDEVFVFYTPNDIWNVGAKEYACGGQIGSTLYIDKSGIHGNNGDNCDQYVELDSNEWVNIGMIKNNAVGNITKGFHDKTYPLLIKIFSESTESTKKKNGGGCADCEAPWIGTNSKGKIVVDKGIIINGKSFDGGYFHKENPMQYTELDKQNIISLKYRENGGPQNIKLVQLAMVKEVGTSFGEAEAIIEVWMDFFADDMDNPKIKEVKVIDKNNILNEHIHPFVTLERCQDNDPIDVKKCLKITFVYSYAKVPQSPVLLAEAIDYNRNSLQTFFNGGLNVTDPNPKLIIEQEPKEEKECMIWAVPTRTNSCQFLPLVEYEKQRAVEKYEELYR